MEINKIYNMDCLEGIRKIPDCSIASIITDPPYFLGLTSNGQKGSFSDLQICTPFYKELFGEFKRVLKKDGCIYFFTDWRAYAFYYPIFDSVIGARNMLVWNKGSGAGSYYTFAHELILYYGREISGGGANVITGIPGFAAGAKKEDGEKIHPAQKPTKLIRKLIRDSTKEGELVLDCFMGSGTTAISCIREHRNYIGFEICENNYEVCMKRIGREKSQEA